jgi:hypothetical protein
MVDLLNIAGSFLWAGHLERLCWQELHNPRLAGGLGVTCVASRGQALLAKQLYLQVAAGGTPAAHLAFWLGQAVGHYIPGLAGGSHSPCPPASLVGVVEVLVEIFAHGTVPPNRLDQAKAATIYAAFLDTPPPLPRWNSAGPLLFIWFGGGCGPPTSLPSWWTDTLCCCMTSCL